MCNCDLCQARQANLHPWQLLWGINSIESQLFQANPGQPVYYYEELARSQRNNPPKEQMKLAA